MKKKIITYLLLFSFFNYLGCSATQYSTVKEYDPKLLEEDPTLEIYVTTIDSKQYHFTNEEYYYLKNDTLYTKVTLAEYYKEKGKKVETGEMRMIQRKIPLGDIKLLEKSGQNEIGIITAAGKELHLVTKRYYFLENDTLYGKGELLMTDGEQNFEGGIALSDIDFFEKHIKTEYYDTGKSFLLGGGLVLGVVTILAIIFVATYYPDWDIQN